MTSVMDRSPLLNREAMTAPHVRCTYSFLQWLIFQKRKVIHHNYLQKLLTSSTLVSHFPCFFCRVGPPLQAKKFYDHLTTHGISKTKSILVQVYPNRRVLLPWMTCCPFAGCHEEISQFGARFKRHMFTHYERQEIPLEFSQALDEGRYFWWEDQRKDGTISVFICLYPNIP